MPAERFMWQVLAKLVRWFRGFEPGPLPPGRFTDDPHLATALSRRGVCRHRALAFVITSQAVGLPARYVTNEAHAFAEVWIPGRGWRRSSCG